MSQAPLQHTSIPLQVLPQHTTTTAISSQPPNQQPQQQNITILQKKLQFHNRMF